MNKMNKEGGSERRQTQRISGGTPVRVFLDQPTDIESGDYFTLEVTDVSRTGLFLASELVLDEGMWVDLEFVYTGQTSPLRARGRIVRSVLKPTTQAGMGIQLYDLTEKEYSTVENYVA